MHLPLLLRYVVVLVGSLCVLGTLRVIRAWLLVVWSAAPAPFIALLRTATGMIRLLCPLLCVVSVWLIGGITCMYGMFVVFTERRRAGGHYTFEFAGACDARN